MILAYFLTVMLVSRQGFGGESGEIGGLIE